ncbi:hypothetical protein EK21DRAFT_104741 [Setomelanomma holmii]|uniref:Cytochrome b561 domain-containing protein n=1 Tax=Setomelanomma holmii TaxID=210430 RepID=A0A9P4GYE0_9PLEO|nr:hypothetical protein EK21DRAFT_104741 [Setomelanomma holmii]
MSLATRSLFLALVSAGYGGYWGGGRWGGGYDSNDNGDHGYGPYGGYGASASQTFINSRQKILIAHGVLAALAFVLFFPVGSILIRLGSFRGVWLVHGIFQLFAYIVYIVAFGLGVWMVNNLPVNLLDTYHPIIGIVVLVLLFFQPILGFVHHVKFRKHKRRTVWSHGHIWLGRIVITLGIINGGLGLLLASNAPTFTAFRPTQGQIIAYGVVAGIMWLLWVIAAVVGEQRRAKAPAEIANKEAEVEDSASSTTESGTPPPYKGHYA